MLPCQVLLRKARICVHLATEKISHSSGIVLALYFCGKEEGNQLSFLSHHVFGVEDIILKIKEVSSKVHVR